MTKNKLLKFRVDEETFELLEKTCKKNNTNISSYLRQALEFQLTRDNTRKWKFPES